MGNLAQHQYDVLVSRQPNTPMLMSFWRKKCGVAVVNIFGIERVARLGPGAVFAWIARERCLSNNSA